MPRCMGAAPRLPRPLPPGAPSLPPCLALPCPAFPYRSCDKKGKSMNDDKWCADSYADECAAPPNNTKGERRAGSRGCGPGCCSAVVPVATGKQS